MPISRYGHRAARLLLAKTSTNKRSRMSQAAQTGRDSKRALRHARPGDQSTAGRGSEPHATGTREDAGELEDSGT